MTERPACRMRRLLDGSEPPANWPEGVSVRGLADLADARAVHALLTQTYGDAGDGLPGYDAWWNQLSDDDEFDRDLCLLAYDRSDGLAGVAQCWTSAFIKDIAVRPDMRGHGLGEALLRHCFARFAARGADRVDLKVELANLRAMRLYERAGMKRVAWEG